jgi:uncharacterized membrane protein
MFALLTAPYFFLGHVQTHLAGHPTSRQTRAAIGVATMFVFTGAGHFVATEPMVEMLPEWVPARTGIVYVSGVAEIVLALLVLVPVLRRPSGWVLMAMRVGFLPVNIYAAFVNAPRGGPAWGPAYLLIRVPLQAFIAAWIWWFLVRASADGIEEG